MNPLVLIGDRRCGALDSQGDRLGDAVQREVPGDGETGAVLRDTSAGERSLRKIAHIEIFGPFEVRITGRDAGIDGADADGDLNAGFCDIGLVVLNGRVHIAKAAVDFGDAHVGDGEINFTVIGV